MKYLAILTLAIAAFGLGACHHDDTSRQTTTTNDSHRAVYSK